MTPTTRMLVLAAAAVLAAGPAQAQEKVLRESQVTEQALIDALAPAAAASTGEAGDATDGARSRSFRPNGRAAAAVAGAAGAAAQPARTSILVTFIVNSSDLTPPAKGALDVLAAAMKSERLAGVRFTIEGHADPRGGDELNMKLSQARAESVRSYLIASHGLDVERVSAVGKGSTALLNPGEPAAPENRRVTIVALPK